MKDTNEVASFSRTAPEFLPDRENIAYELRLALEELRVQTYIKLLEILHAAKGNGFEDKADQVIQKFLDCTELPHELARGKPTAAISADRNGLVVIK